LVKLSLKAQMFKLDLSEGNRLPFVVQ